MKFFRIKRTVIGEDFQGQAMSGELLLQTINNVGNALTWEMVDFKISTQIIHRDQIGLISKLEYVDSNLLPQSRRRQVGVQRFFLGGLLISLAGFAISDGPFNVGWQPWIENSLARTPDAAINSDVATMYSFQYISTREAGYINSGAFENEIVADYKLVGKSGIFS